MKKALLVFSFLLITISTFSTNPFKEPTSDELGFEELDALQIYLEANPNADLEKVYAPYLAERMEGQKTFLDTQEIDLIIPPFFWGCVLGVLGIILVYVLTDQDKDATKKALLGCIVTAGTFVVVYVAIAVLGLTWAASY